ncbi:4-hydroxy-tetrahydrodipicolinate synthase [Corynebacterium ammoniagenes]|uniref:4-hydroxy-tetrahydrodipicolinate synthase n=1 Tax=Corynebacterium ammoniagenes DSM 20306 TaxID=649754 RepID=A0ABN0AD77_CORAM|nr:4-hydroxy-tetrahydrodipicolinate synthase [Corynebacterium ammoniagenes]AQS73874.1 dihydrodipicolinate synthase family protein [Corynebacterium ammoniagenes]EFG80750.1 dihydrodipicolinate synthase [Corynebacterium ammoniagenes DSM 20306]
MFKGIYCPSITPITNEGKVDFEVWSQHLNFLIENGIDGILILGSIGEFYAFDEQEKRDIIDFAVKEIAGRAKVLVGTGNTRLNDTINLTKHTQDSGADGAVVVSPYYFGPSEAAAEQYFGKLAEAVDLPLILYNFPDRTGSDLSPELVGKLSKAHSNIVGIKDTVDNISHTRGVIAATDDSFAVFSGFDEYYFPNRIAGGVGIISGLTNVFPDLFAEMHRTIESGEINTAKRLASDVSELMQIYAIGDQFIHTIKTAVKSRYLSDLNTATREPFIELTDEEQESVEKIVEKFGRK